jgi:octaheme c-type cytochrome (tetrathionate reductase family)
VLAGTLGGCQTGLPVIPPPQPSFHERVFSEIVPGGFQGPNDCLICHENVALDLAAGGHWNWRGVSANIVGHETETHGKRDLINSFFIGVPSNEGRCAQCHPSYGYTDKNFDFGRPMNVDCLICHDTTGAYAKAPTAGGGAAAIMSNGELALAAPADLLPLVYQVGPPTRRNCGACHFSAEGGDNVMHGDLSSALIAPTEDVDVHMGSTETGGQDFACQTCHGKLGHGFAGWQLHSLDEGGDPPACTRCHSGPSPHTQFPPLDLLLDFHLPHLACEMCHIPTFARHQPTLVGWFWDTAGQDISPIPTDALGQPTYDKNRGTLVWGKDVTPVPHWSNGKWRRKLIGTDDTFTNAGTVGDPVVIAEPVATKDTPGAKIRPFKVMVGRQPADTLNHRLIVPHLFGAAAGPNPFCERFDWAAALQEGAAYSGVAYSGTFGFVNTVSYLPINHEIPPKEHAPRCEACHGATWHWADLGLTDPLLPH